MASSLAAVSPGESGVWTLRLHRWVSYVNGLIAAIAATGLLGWLAHMPALTSLGADFPPILPSGILALLATAGALAALLHSRRPSVARLVWAAAGLVALLAALSLAQRLRFLPWAEPTGGIMSVGTSVTYFILAGALALAPCAAARAQRWSCRLAAAVGGIALVALVGLTFRIVRLDLAVPSVGMALPVALGLLAASFSLVAMRPKKRFLQLLEHDSPGAIAVRRLLPAAIALPLLVGWAQALAQRSGWFDIAAGEGVVTVSMILVCTVLILWTSSKLDEMNARRSLAELRAETQREWLEVTLANIGDAVITANAEGRVGFMNPATEALFQVDGAAAAARPVSELVELVDERSGEPLQSPLEQAFAELRPVTVGGYPAVRLHDASLRPVDVSAVPIRDGSGRLIGGVLVLHDASAHRARENALRDAYAELDRRVGERTQRELEQLLLIEHRLRGEAERASRAKDEFLAIVSHELRSPLNALRGWSQLLSGTPNPDPALAARAAQAIKRNVEHQTRLIDDLLDTSRIIIGKLVLECRPVNLVEVVHAAIELSRGSAQAKKIELRFYAEQPVVTANGDPGRLQQVVINLLSNGIKFTPVGGFVEIHLKQKGERAELRVSDNGIGIEPDFLPYVFDRFSQADASPTRRYSGLGIGLALVRHLVEMHGGGVSVHSPGPGQGATFSVDLPAGRKARAKIPASAGDSEAPASSLAGIRVLVVDDEADARDVMQLTLALAGAEVHAFASGLDLLAMLDEKAPLPAPTVLLLDIAMPGEDGFSVLAAVRAIDKQPFIPALAVTAFTHLDRSHFAAAGFQGCLGKPVEAEQLIASILALAGQGQVEKEA